MLQDLADYTNNPAWKPERTIQARLQAAEHQIQIARLQRENTSLRTEVHVTQAELNQMQEDLDLLQGEVHTAQ